MTQADQPDPIIAEIRGFLAVDPLKALGELVRAEHRARLRSLGEAHRIGLRSLRAEFLAHRTELLSALNQICQEPLVSITPEAAFQFADQLATQSVDPTLPVPVDPADIQSLQHRLFNKKGNLRLIQERMTEYVLTTDVPLHYIEQERQCIADIQQLEQQLGVEVGAYDDPGLLAGLAQDLLNLIALFRTEKLGTQLTTIRSVVADLPLPESLEGSQVVTAALGLWEDFNQIVRAMVVKVFVWVRARGDSSLERQVAHAFKANRRLRRLASDIVVRDWEIIQVFAAADYQWPSRVKHERVERLSVSRFLIKTGLRANPFQPGAAQFDSLLLESYAAPQNADEINSARPMLLVSQDAQDRSSLHLLMDSQHQQLGLPLGLPAVCELADEFKMAPQPVKAYLTLIVHGVAWTWLKFLPLNAGVWFDLTRRQQRVLVDLLAWHTQVKQRPIDQLYHNGLADDSEAQAVKEDMAALLDQATMVAEPGDEDLLRWLEVRPPFLAYTYALLDCPFEASQEIETALRRIVQVANRLLTANVVLKIFAAESPKLVVGDDLDTFSVEWGERGLTQMLDDRIRLTSERGYRNFVDLFFPDDRAGEVAVELIREANGSLGRLQRLGQKIILAHVAAGLTDWNVDTTLKTIHEQH